MATVSGSATVGGVSFPVSAAVTLPSAAAPPPPSGSSQCYFGVWDDGSGYPSDGVSYSWAGVEKFAAAKVLSATYYMSWLAPFPTGLNNLAKQNGATLYLNLEPQNPWGGGANPSMSDIAAGKYDASYLAPLGNAIKAGGHNVLLTFAHEMNGSWYPWGSGAITPAQWVAAWKHVYTTVKAAAGGLASFAWCPNNNDVGPVTPYWPGQAFCDQAAFDGYLNTTSSSQTFSSFIAPTVAEIRKLTSGSVWNAETGVLGTNREARITAFVNDMHAAGLLGFTQFNEGDYLLDASETSALTAAVNAWNAS
ncbi:MAG TPA: glycosyl hydrolase [Streptosporangiaceae bacterium]|nr:glycosyl hydrolase [Streptosporangiaceae bacterium]